MDRVSIVTNNIKPVNDDLAKLKQHFPHCFDKDGNFQLEKFKNNLTENEINFSTESYGLDWLGKSYARLLASDPATTLLKADESHNAKPENINSENLLIKGDNLEVLKHLVNAYHEQVKMIYIDPPYNTGSDGFVYNDDRKFTVAQLQELTGVDTDKAKRILDFTKQKSNSHSAWLTFMYPRLYIAKQLLKDDGVIFVSIDDNEVAQLRLLMDEVFGEENFLNEVILENDSRARPYGSIATTHEYILIYSKSNDCIYETLFDAGKKFNFYDDVGGFDLYELRNRNTAFNINNRPNLYYSFWVNPENKDNNDLFEVSLDKQSGWVEVYPQESQGMKTVWRWGKEKAKENLNSYVFAKHANSDTGYQIVKKYRETTFSFSTVWANKEIKTDKGTLEIKALFDNKKYFDFPKPKYLIKQLLQISTRQQDSVLDFFSGSGTTGDAVMQLNAEDGGNRKYILVQLPEPCNPKTATGMAAIEFLTNLNKPTTIFEITKERLLRAAKKLNTNLDERILKLKQELDTQENQTEIDRLERCKTQNTFKTFETTPLWEDYNFEAEKFDSTQTLFDAGKLSKDDIKSLLITWKTYDGIALTHDLESIDLEGYTAYYGGGTLYLMDKDFSSTNLKALLTMIDTEHSFSPSSIICFGYHFESARIRELAENIKSYSNKKNIDIDFVTRY